MRYFARPVFFSVLVTAENLEKRAAVLSGFLVCRGKIHSLSQSHDRISGFSESSASAAAVAETVAEKVRGDTGDAGV